jgi:hypothetical protein
MIQQECCAAKPSKMLRSISDLCRSIAAIVPGVSSRRSRVSTVFIFGIAAINAAQQML